MKTPHFIVDDRGKKIGVLLTVEDCESLLSAPNKIDETQELFYPV